jgi:hypothetical protein
MLLSIIKHTLLATFSLLFKVTSHKHRPNGRYNKVIVTNSTWHHSGSPNSQYISFPPPVFRQNKSISDSVSLANKAATSNISEAILVEPEIIPEWKNQAYGVDFTNVPNLTKSDVTEYYISAILEEDCALINSSKYTLWQNIYLPRNDCNETTQIDHLFITEQGVFVIETKRWIGEIKGNSRSKTWLQTTRYGDKKSHQNPLRQNYCHLKAIETLISPVIPTEYIHSLVVFIDEDINFQKSKPKGVLFDTELTDYFENMNEKVLTTHDMSYIKQQINKHKKENSKSTQREHRKFLSRSHKLINA